MNRHVFPIDYGRVAKSESARPFKNDPWVDGIVMKIVLPEEGEQPSLAGLGGFLLGLRPNGDSFTAIFWETTLSEDTLTRKHLSGGYAIKHEATSRAGQWQDLIIG